MSAHTPNLPQRSRLPVFDKPEGFENRLLFSSDVAFTFRCKRWATSIAFQLVCAQYDTNTCQFSNAKSGFKSFVSTMLHKLAISQPRNPGAAFPIVPAFPPSPNRPWCSYFLPAACLFAVQLPFLKPNLTMV